MALIAAVATGVWSSGAIWAGGSLPASGDTVEAAGFTVTIDQNVTVAVMTNVSGGGFSVPSTLSGTRTITATLTGGTATLLTCSHTTGNTVSITGTITGGTAAAAYGLRNSSTGAVVVTAGGNILGGSNATAYGVYNASTGTVTITGNSTGATATGTYNAAGGTVNLTGNAYGSATANSAHGINNASSGTVTVTGNAYGGSASTQSAYGLENASTGTATITGDSTGGAAVASFGSHSVGVGLLTVGRAVGGTVETSVGVACSAATVPARVTAIAWSANGGSPLRGFVVFVDSPTLNKATVALVGGSTRDLQVRGVFRPVGMSGGIN